MQTLIETEQRLRSASTAALVDVVVRLTNMIRNARTADRMADLRAERDMVKAELIRRTGA